MDKKERIDACWKRIRELILIIKALQDDEPTKK